MTPETVRSALKESSMLQSRIGAGSSDLLEGIKPSFRKTKSPKDLAIDAMLLPLDLADTTMAMLSYLQGKRMAEAYGIKGRAAIEYANDHFAQTQSTGEFHKKAPVQQNLVGSLITTLGTQNIQQLNAILYEILGFKNPEVSKLQGAGQAAKTLLAIGALNTFYKNVLNMQSPEATPIDEFVTSMATGHSPPRAVLDGALEFLEYVPLISSARRYGADSLGGIVIDKSLGALGAKKFQYETVGKIIDDLVTKEKITKIQALERLLKSEQFADSMAFAGIPVGPFVRAYRQYEDQKSGKAPKSTISRVTGKNQKQRTQEKAKKEKFDPAVLNDMNMFRRLLKKVAPLTDS